MQTWAQQTSFKNNKKKKHNPKYLNDHLLYNTAHFISVNTLYQRELMPYILQLQTALNRLHQFCVEQTLPPA